MKYVCWLNLLVCMVTSAILAIDGPPAWTRRTPTNDSAYKYYVGRSTSDHSEAIAFNEATRDAYEQAIRDNFGFYTEIETGSYETSKDFSSTKRVSDRSRKIRLENIEQVDSYSDSSRNTWVLYRYQKSAIETEKRRLASKKESDVEFSELGSDLVNGALEVVTVPGGASILVDDAMIPFMETPLRLFGKVPPGRHRVTIDHPQFETVEEDVIIVPGKKVSIRKILKPATGQLTISSTPSGAEVLVAGKSGKTPITLDVPAAKTLKIELRHPEAQRFLQEVQVPKNEIHEMNVMLPMKPALLAIRSNPTGAQVIINGKPHRATPTGFLNIEPGTLSIEVVKDGFAPTKFELLLHGGEKRHLPLIRLAKASRYQFETLSDASPSIETNESGATKPIVSMGVYASGSTISEIDQSGVGVLVDLHFRQGGFGFEAGFFGKVNSVTYRNGTLSHSAWGINLAATLFPRNDAGLFFASEVRWINTTFKIASENQQSVETSQFGLGLGVGYLSSQSVFFRFGVHRYTDTNIGYEGSVCASGALGMSF